MNDITALISLAVVCLGIGFALGILVSSLRGEPGQAKEKARENTDLVEVIHLWRDRITGDLVPEIDGKTFSKLRDLKSGQRNHLVQTLEDLCIWAEFPAARVVARDAPAVDTPTSASPGPVNSTSTPAPFKPLRTADQPENELRSSLNPMNVLAWAFQPDANRTVSSTKSIAAQIDEILQQKLENSHLADRGIRLMELPGKGMVVMVGLEQYDGVGSVPDPEIRDLIRECVIEWEQRTGEA